MTLTADRRGRSSTRSVRPGSSVPAPSSPPPLVIERVLDDVYRVADRERTVGYIQIAGPVFVVLVGAVYNTSVEIAQCLDLDTAVAHLECARG